MMADNIVAIAQREVPKDTWALHNSIRRIETRDGARVIADLKDSKGRSIAYFVEYGTGIYAKNGRGRKTPWVYMHRAYGKVLTVGREATPFMTTAVDEARLKSKKILRGAWRNSGLSNR